MFTGIFVADMAKDLDLGRNVIELFALLLADAAHLMTAITHFLCLGKIVDDIHPRQVIGQRFAAPLFATVRGNGDLSLFSIRIGGGLVNRSGSKQG